MEVIVTVLLCTIGFFLYILDKNNHEISFLKKKLVEKETTMYLPNNNDEILRLTNILQEKNNEILKIKNTLQEKENEILRLQNAPYDRDKEILRLRNAFKEKNNETLDMMRILREKENEISKLKSFTCERSRHFPDVSKLIKDLHERDAEILKLKETLRENELQIRESLKDAGKSSQDLTRKRYVSVIFKKGSKKRYDYFLKDNDDIKIGDFVEVYAVDKCSGKSKWNVVKVVYVSSPGEVSKYAESTIIRKADYNKW